MIIVKPKFTMPCDENFTVLEDGAVAFDERIQAVGEAEQLRKRYPNARFFEYPDAVLAPAFINPHVHLEFSANKTSLVYGDFLEWLGSVIASRGALSQAANEDVIASAIKTMQRSGVASFGAVSSFGGDLDACANCGGRVVFFNEILGTNEAALEQNLANFTARFEASLERKSPLFTPAVSVHSPYSTHPDLAAAALNLARKRGLVVSTHFMESEHEKSWLEGGSGGFKEWLGKFNPAARPLYTPSSFIAMFAGVRTLFTHCVWADDFSGFDRELHSLTHCAVSNRLLGKRTLNLRAALDVGVSVNIGTDGLSSNISLNFLDELRANLLIHADFDPLELAKILLLASTKNAAKALNLDAGEIKEGKLADLALYGGFADADAAQLPLMLILHAGGCEKLFVGGSEVKLKQI